ncbi:oxygenase MpaB family protein [Sphingomonas colocasiae]|uniref:Oxygenase MpaB family protein n=1 Tax=Sphingomonas colocasiae TaxID=1848973 RepID=A0ABS7PHR2_9SPHN|nr:oxygenase MpaB family protein [Sphingomonas colocasiae]MBY8820842.1 oxygenase MpaB family protein [Sphingomonas colocasiae]
MTGPAPNPYAIDYLNPPGAPSLIPPGSPQWRVFKNVVALGIGGVAAVLLEFADARIRSGVWDHSTYKIDPVGRSRRTGIAALAGVFAPADTARRIIGGVNRMHRKVVGDTPSGEPYRALDPELLDWVSATASYGFLEAYHRFVAPVSDADRLRYYHDGEVVARLYGVENAIRSDADFFAMLDHLAPRFEPHPINLEFLDIVMSGRGAPAIPRGLHRALGHAAVSILPPAVRERLELGPEFDLSGREAAALRIFGKLADRIPVPNSPPWQSARRQGLPGRFAWRSPDAQQRLLRRSVAAGAASTSQA